MTHSLFTSKTALGEVGSALPGKEAVGQLTEVNRPQIREGTPRPHLNQGLEHEAAFRARSLVAAATDAGRHDAPSRR